MRSLRSATAPKLVQFAKDAIFSRSARKVVGALDVLSSRPLLSKILNLIASVSEMFEWPSPYYK